MQLFRTLATFVSLLVIQSGMTAHADINSSLEPSTKTKLATPYKYIYDYGFLYGFVWNDVNGDGKVNGYEYPLKNTVIYIDANNNGIRDSEEMFTKTNLAGFYKFKNLEPGEYIIRQEVPFGWRSVSGGDGQDVTPIDVIGEQEGPILEIIGGDETDIDEYPFMVAIGEIFGDEFFQYCGGVLITDRWVVTAAHCSDSTNLENARALAGTNNVEDGSGQLLSVKNIYIHPGFESTDSGFDIALWELDQPVLLGDDELETVSMLTPKNAELAVTDTLATTVGWGVSSIDSRLLQDVHLPVVDSGFCSSVYSEAINFETQICGGVLEGGIDACQGDSGGPLLVRDFEKQQWRLAGITSYGNGCALPGNPGVWARVSELSDWAKSIAVEPSRSHRVTIKAGDFEKASFGNQSTQYEPSRDIEPRWQLVNFTFENEPSVSFMMNWSIIDESGMVRTFDCEIDADGLGVLVMPTEQPCFVGSNQAMLPSIEEKGLYLPTLTAQLENTNFTRHSRTGFTVGTPDETLVNGELTVEDNVDSDFPFDIYYIDYFDLTEVSNEKVISIQVTSDDFDVYVGLYDGDQRKENGVGGLITAFFGDEPGAPAEYTFFPDGTVDNYLIGVSTFGAEQTGSYTVKIINEGNPVPTILSLPMEGVVERAFRKLPQSRVVIPAALFRN